MLAVKTLLVLAFATFAVASTLHKTSLMQAEYDLEKAESLFEEFIKTYERQYVNENEKKARLEIFKENLKTINELNKKSHSPTFGINLFADLSPDEKKMLSGSNPEKSYGFNACQQGFARDFNVTGYAPDTVDWRLKNGVTPVKNQGGCGGCWAFATVGLIESQMAIKTGQILDLAEQQLIDCDTNDSGCSGGLPSQALSFLMQAEGMEEESYYPYVQYNNICKYNPSLAKVRVTGCRVQNTMSEDQIKELVASYGPVAIMISAQDLHHYTGGILSFCSGTEWHTPLVVGYGSDNGQDYWIVKNSWGPTWGENGFFRMQRGVNMCNIVNSYVTTANVI